MGRLQKEVPNEGERRGGPETSPRAVWSHFGARFGGPAGGPLELGRGKKGTRKWDPKKNRNKILHTDFLGPVCGMSGSTGEDYGGVKYQQYLQSSQISAKRIKISESRE